MMWVSEVVTAIVAEEEDLEQELLLKEWDQTESQCSVTA